MCSASQLTCTALKELLCLQTGRSTLSMISVFFLKLLKKADKLEYLVWIGVDSMVNQLDGTFP